LLSSPALQLVPYEQTDARAPITMDPREILERFDSERDLEMRHEEALALLHAQRAHESADLAVRVGTAWAHIRHADLSHLLRDGIAWIDQSRASVAQLEASEASAGPFAAYVLARWHAAAGRILYRCGDARIASIELTTAAKQCTRKDLWYVRPDILSDLLRVQIDLLDSHGRTGTANASRMAVRRFSTLREVMNRLAGRRGIDLGAVRLFAGELAHHLGTGRTGKLGVSRERLAEVIGICDPREARRRCELLRGLINLHLNRALLIAPDHKRGWDGDRDRSRELAWWCAWAAFGVGDRHRLAQALRHLTSLEA